MLSVLFFVQPKQFISKQVCLGRMSDLLSKRCKIIKPGPATTAGICNSETFDPSCLHPVLLAARDSSIISRYVKECDLIGVR